VHLSPQFRAERHGRTTNLANETPASFVAEGLYRLRKNEFETSQGIRSFPDLQQFRDAVDKVLRNRGP